MFSLFCFFFFVEDPVAIAEPCCPDSMTKFLLDVFYDSSTSSMFYTTDLMVLIDIVTRQLTDLSQGDEVSLSRSWVYKKKERRREWEGFGRGREGWKWKERGQEERKGEGGGMEGEKRRRVLGRVSKGRKVLNLNCLDVFFSLEFSSHTRTHTLSGANSQSWASPSSGGLHLLLRTQASSVLPHCLPQQNSSRRRHWEHSGPRTRQEDMVLLSRPLWGNHRPLILCILLPSCYQYQSQLIVL